MSTVFKEPKGDEDVLKAEHLAAVFDYLAAGGRVLLRPFTFFRDSLVGTEKGKAYCAHDLARAEGLLRQAQKKLEEGTLPTNELQETAKLLKEGDALERSGDLGILNLHRHVKVVDRLGDLMDQVLRIKSWKRE